MLTIYNYVIELKVRIVRGMLGKRADELYQTRVTTPTATQSVRTHDKNNNNPSPAQRRRHQLPAIATLYPMLLTLSCKMSFFEENHIKSLDKNDKGVQTCKV